MGGVTQGDKIAPRVARITLLYNPPTAPFIEASLNPFKPAAASVRAEAIVLSVNDIPSVESLIITEAREPDSGLVVIQDAFTVHHRAEITALTARECLSTGIERNRLR